MPVYAYKALDSVRSTAEGTISADTPRQARELLRERGLVVRNIEVHASGSGKKSWFKPSAKAPKVSQVTTSIRELSTLLGAGIPILEALDTISRQHKGGFQTILKIVHDRIKNGSSISEALAEHPQAFDNLSVSMVDVGEQTGTLAEVLSQLAEFKEKSLLLKDRVTTALAYPIFLTCVMVGVTVFLMTFVLPNLLENLVAMGKELPLPTRIVKSTSDFLIQYGMILLVFAVALGVGTAAFLRTKQGSWLWYRNLIRLPVIGEMAKKQSLSKVALILSTLLKSGLVFDRAVEITAAATNNLVIRKSLIDVKNEVGAGQEMGVALEKQSVFPPVMIQIFRVGQESGQLEPMLDRLATDYDRQIESASSRMASLIEPILILLLALVVGIIMAAVILPILEAGKVV